MILIDGYSEASLYTVASIVLISLVSLVGLFFFRFKEATLKRVLILLVSFSAGTLLGDVFIHLLPAATEETGFTLFSSMGILGGIILFFILEKFVFWHHCHKNSHTQCKPFVYMNLLGDGMHNFIDGSIVAGSYLTDIKLGMVTTLAVLMHEIPQEIGDFGVLLHGGFSRRRALLMNFISALGAVLGGALILMMGWKFPSLIRLLLLLSSGHFIYIAMCDLIPELHQANSDLRDSLVELLYFIAGIGIMFLLLLFE